MKKFKAKLIYGLKVSLYVISCILFITNMIAPIILAFAVNPWLILLYFGVSITFVGMMSCKFMLIDAIRDYHVAMLKCTEGEV